jgi:hypothetical protein
MHKRILVLTTSALILAYGAGGAIAQDRMTQQADQQHTQHHPAGQEGAGTIGPGGTMACGMMGQGGMGQGGMMGPGMMGSRGMMGRGMMGAGPMGPSMMMRMIFALMDSDGDGTIELPEFQAAHERIFKAMDSNKDGRLTQEEMRAFMRGTRSSAAPE